jgi:hypothetical protein
MIKGYRFLVILGLLAVSLMTVGAVSADIILIPDSGFETPIINLQDFPIGCTTDAPSLLPWVGQAASIYNPAIYSGLYNEGNITPDDGSQVGYLGLQISNTRAYLYQTLPETYAAGEEYSLTAAVAQYDAKYSLDPGESVTVRLGYWTDIADGNVGPTIVAERVITAAEVTAATWTYFTANTGPVSGDAVGKQIVVYLAKGDGSTTGAQMIIDNVQLLSSVPEPGTVVLLVSGLIGLVTCAWRKRK